MTAWYNENDPRAAAWLRELIKAGAIAPGIVDERDIRDVRPAELVGYTQCHFFAGIGVWSYALRLAGWPDERPVWTGSCPCQPFSTAGKGAGFADERHLWPDWFHLIALCRPITILGEQVANRDGLTWLDLVLSDLEAPGYAVGVTDLCVASVGAPGVRQRLFFVADTHSSISGQGSQVNRRRSAGGTAQSWAGLSCGGVSIKLADTDRDRCEEVSSSRIHDEEHHAQPCGDSGRLGYRIRGGRHSRAIPEKKSKTEGPVRSEPDGTEPASSVGQLDITAGIGRQKIGDQSTHGQPLQAGPTNGFWRDADWIFCRDGKWRPVEPSTSPLVTGAPERMGRLRGYGNAINAQVAKAFIEAYMSIA